MKRLMVISALLLSACGGGSSESNSLSNQPVDKTEPAAFHANGIYLSADAALLVDANKQVWASDLVDEVIIRFDSAKAYSNKLDLNGVTLWEDGQESYSNPNLSVSLTVDGDRASAMTVITNQTFVHDFLRQPASLPISEIFGIYNNDKNNAQWMIDNAGNVHVNKYGDCTISGKLNANQFYYDIEATAFNCADSAFNGKYKGVAFTATYLGKRYLTSVIANSDNEAMWDLIELR